MGGRRNAARWPAEAPLPLGVRSSGIDLGDVLRFSQALERSGEAFACRVFSPTERSGSVAGPACSPAELTAVFSIKESVVKAIGGMPPGGRYRDITVSAPRRDGCRHVALAGVLEEWAQSHGVDVLARESRVNADLVLTWATTHGRAAA